MTPSELLVDLSPGDPFPDEPPLPPDTPPPIDPPGSPPPFPPEPLGLRTWLARLAPAFSRLGVAFWPQRAKPVRQTARRSWSGTGVEDPSGCGT